MPGKSASRIWRLFGPPVLLQHQVSVCRLTVRGRCWWISRVLYNTQQPLMMILWTLFVMCFHLTSFHRRCVNNVVWTDLYSVLLTSEPSAVITSCCSRSSVEQSSIARHYCPLSLHLCFCLKSHLFSLSYLAFWLFSHLHSENVQMASCLAYAENHIQTSDICCLVWPATV